MVEPIANLPDSQIAPQEGQRGRAFLYALIATLLFGTAYVGAKVVLRELPPFTAAASRFVISTVILWTILLARGKPPRPRGDDWKTLAIAGIFQTTLYFAFQYTGLGYTSASNTAVIANSRPIFVALLSAVLLAEPLRRGRVLGIIIAFGGVLLLTTDGRISSLSFSSTHAFGDFLIVLNAMSGAVGLVYNKKTLSRLPVLPVIVYSTTVGAAGLLPLAALELRKIGVPHVSLTAWGGVIYLAIFCSTIPYLFWYSALARLEAAQTAVFLFFVPVVSVILSVVLLGEHISVYFVIGALLVLAGAYLTNHRTSQPAAAVRVSADGRRTP